MSAERSQANLMMQNFAPTQKELMKMYSEIHIHKNSIATFGSAAYASHLIVERRLMARGAVMVRTASPRQKAQVQILSAI